LAAALQVLAPFAIGFTVFVCHLIAIPIDNCSINRALMPQAPKFAA
jgi:glycerol uptake facilitator-like aquaporin